MSEPSELNDILSQLPDCLLADRALLQRNLQKIRKRLQQNQPTDRLLVKTLQLCQASVQACHARAAAEVNIVYPEQLPIAQKQQDIAKAIRESQVIILAGETGSGKTTQIPKICLELGRGIVGRIGHTQPRRLAARSVAQRIAEELGCEIGSAVGYQVRFHGQVSDSSRIKLMTDGILLNEIHHDPDLLQYDTLIIDEAHERSLNIDFILGYLKPLLQRRPDLKLIVTSATIATERFSAHFNDAPVIEVSGRTYPVEVRYRPLQSDDPDEQDRQLVDGVLHAVDELSRIDRGDMLVFLSGEREIRDVAEALGKHRLQATEILPLYSRLSFAEQNRVFRAHQQRRIILATNVAETSLTVPGIRFVVDAGTARISRYSHRSKVQRLPIEKISQASANQRKGRCGRVGPGVCVRLYDEDDFNLRDEFTQPEIQRTNLAAVILNMQMLGLGDVEAFPFMDPPDRRYINDGYRLLHELGAVDTQRQLTTLGRKLARLSVDPRLARMVMQADREGCVHEVLVVVCALEIQDPRERPMDAQQQADEAHAVFADKHSDFVSLLNLWRNFHEQSRHLSNNKLRRWCRDHFISYRRMLEWHDLFTQLKQQVREIGLSWREQEADVDAMHRSLLAGLIGQIGLRLEEREYQGSHGKRFMIHPGSVLASRPSKWLMAAELVETRRVYARMVAPIKPEWVEQLAPQLVRYSYSEPRWQARRGHVFAAETVTLYGLTLISGRQVNFGRVDPVAARQIFIQQALVEGDMQSRAAFFRHNQGVLARIQDMEDKTRRRDIQQDEQVLYDFYDSHIPAEICNQPALEKWVCEQAKGTPDFLFIDEQALLRDQAVSVSPQDYPDVFAAHGLKLPLRYHFAPGEEDDGVTVLVPLMVLNQLEMHWFEWLVPGLLEEKVLHLIKGLPKSSRRQFVPVPEYARACRQALVFAQGRIGEALSAELKRMTAFEVPAQAWNDVVLPAHCRMRFCVIDADGEPLDCGRDLDELQQRFAGQAASAFSTQAQQQGEASSVREVNDWDFGDLPERVTVQQAGIELQAFPALQVQDDKIQLVQLDQLEQAERSTRQALVQLYRQQHRRDIDYLLRHLPEQKQLCLYYAALGDCAELKHDIIDVAIFRALQLDKKLIRAQADFQRLSRQAEKTLVADTNALAGLLLDILQHAHEVRKQFKSAIKPAWLRSVKDMQQQLDYLLFPGFLHVVPAAQLSEYPRYLQAMRVRIDKLQQQPQRDEQLLRELQGFWQRCMEVLPQAEQLVLAPQALQTYRWMLEAYRISLFAQELKTPLPVSAKRLNEQWRLVQQAV